MECPVCRRHIENETVCPRCKTDLSYMQELRQKAAALFVKGRRFLAAKDFGQACIVFRRAYAIYAIPEYRRALFTALICSGRYRDALTSYPGRLRR